MEQTIKETIDIKTIKKEAEQGFAGHKDIMLEALNDYRRWFIEKKHPVDEYSESDKQKIKEIDEAIKFLENRKLSGN